MPSAGQFEWPADTPLFEVMWRAVSESVAGNGALAAGDFAVTPGSNSRELDVAAGTAFYDGATSALGSATTVGPVSTGDSDDDRWDTVYYDTATDSPDVREGTPATYPEPPDVQGDEILLATVYVPAEFDAAFAAGQIYNWRGLHQAAGQVRYPDSTGKFSASDVESALDVLEQAAQLSAYPLAPGTDLNVNAYPFANSDLANSTVTVNAGTGLATTNASIGLGGSGTLSVDSGGITSTELASGAVTTTEISDGTILDGDIDGSTTIARGKLDDQKVTTTVSSSSYTTQDEEVIFVATSTIGAAATITLASVDAEDGNTIVVSDLEGAADTHAITVDTEGSETIHGESSKTIDNAGGALVFTSDGTNWSLGGGGAGGGGDGLTVESIATDASGTVSAGESGVVHITSVGDGETLTIEQGSLLLADGQAAPTDLDLIIATLDNSGAASKQTTILSGDGSAVHDDETGDPLASYDNSSGSAETVAILVDNGNFNSGTGAAQDVFAGAIGGVE